jgi:hypothetical protein
VGAEKVAIEKDKSTRFARSLLFAGRAKRYLSLPKVFVLALC